MLVTVALLVIIVLGLTAMFNQTRKAFTTGLANVDYQDAGRVAMDLITRELEQMTPTYYSTYSGNPNPNSYANALNFYADISPYNSATVWPMLAGDSTNFSLDSLYFVTHYNQQWNAIGYRVLPSDSANSVFTLYRYGANNATLTQLLGSPTHIVAGAPFNDFMRNPPVFAPLSRVIDGVVDFRIRAYDRNGVLILIPRPDLNPNPDLVTNWIAAGGYSRGGIFDGDIQYGFYSNAVPAYVEVELGIMESPTLARLQSYTNNPGAYFQYLTSHAAQVHIFRQRVSIPAFDPATYP